MIEMELVGWRWFSRKLMTSLVGAALASQVVPLMKISASIYSSKGKSLLDLVSRLDRIGVDAFHVDSIDELGVFADVELIREYSTTPIDVHVISAHPERYFDRLLDHKVEFVSFQYEQLARHPRFPLELTQKTQVGLSLGMNTPIDVFDDYAEDCSFVMLMTTVPGKSGGVFDDRCLNKLDAIRTRYPGIPIHIDGGVNQSNASKLRTHGAAWAVSGSYLMNADRPPEALLRLKSRLESGDATVTHCMRRLNELAVLSEEESLDPARVLAAIESKHLGFCVVLSPTGHLRGVVSDGDIRRAVLSGLQRGEMLSARELVNERPLTVDAKTTLNELFQVVETHPRTLGFVPVNDNDGRLLGCVSFNDLMRGSA